MDPQNQNDQDQKKQSEGGIGQGINAINNLVGFRNSLRGAGSKAAVQAGKLAAQTAAKGLLANPITWIVLGIITLAVVVFTIVSGLGPPPVELNNQTPIQTQSTPVPLVAL